MARPGQSPADRRGQTITVTVAFSITVVLLCLFIRLYMRWPWRKMMSRNDILAVVATVFVVGHAACTSTAVASGFGYDKLRVSEEDQQTIRQAMLIGNLLFYLAASIATMSIVEFIIQLKGSVKIRMVDYGLRIATPIWGLVGVVVMIVLLALNTADVPSAVPIALAAVAILIQLLTFVAAVLIAIPLQTDRRTKAKVLLGFSPCFLVVAAFILSAVVIPPTLFHDNFTVGAIKYVICTQCILLFLIVYATTPPLFQISKRFQTGYTAPVIDERNTMSGSAGFGSRTPKYGKGSGKQESYEFKNMSGSNHITSQVSAVDRSERDWHRHHPERPKRDRSVKQGREGDSQSMASDSSQKIIISKTITQSSVNV